MKRCIKDASKNFVETGRGVLGKNAIVPFFIISIQSPGELS
jgi:hypothetical protein